MGLFALTEIYDLELAIGSGFENLEVGHSVYVRVSSSRH